MIGFGTVKVLRGGAECLMRGVGALIILRGVEAVLALRGVGAI